MPRIAELALQADLCYNIGRNIVVPEDAVNISRPVANLYWRSTTMDTLPPHADNGNIPNASGIYKITCTANKRIYIGSALNLYRRKHKHFSCLRHNKHDNLHMQRAWNKYGEQAFTFEVLELVLPVSLTAREQYWFNKLKPFGNKGFNILREAGSILGTKRSLETREKMRGRKHTPEEIEKMRLAHLGKKHTPEHIENNRQAQLKRSPEIQEKMSQSKLGKKASPEAIENMRQGQLGRKHTPETIEKIRQAQNSPELQEKKRQAMLGRKMSPETIAKRSATRTGMRYKKKEQST